ncbi:MAG: TetR/AcrR family transcriptional regulator [Leadbetterella sp.]
MVEERILEVSERLFHQFGIKSVSMDDIAKETGISKKTIYQHFTDKEALVYTAMVIGLEAEKKRMDDLVAQFENPIEQMVEQMKCFKELLSGMNVTFMYDLEKSFPRAFEEYKNFKNYILESLANNLTAGIQKGYYRKEINITILASLRVESVDMGFRLNFLKMAGESIFDTQMQLLEHFLRGIFTEKGLQVYESLKSK